MLLYRQFVYGGSLELDTLLNILLVEVQVLHLPLTALVGVVLLALLVAYGSISGISMMAGHIDLIFY